MTERLYQPQDPERLADGTLSAAEIARREQANADAAPAVTRCAWCDWTHDGTAGEGRAAFAEHRVGAHPQVKVKRTGRKKPVGSFSLGHLERGRASSIAKRRAA